MFTWHFKLQYVYITLKGQKLIGTLEQRAGRNHTSSWFQMRLTSSGVHFFISIFTWDRSIWIFMYITVWDFLLYAAMPNHKKYIHTENFQELKYSINNVVSFSSFSTIISRKSTFKERWILWIYPNLTIVNF